MPLTLDELTAAVTTATGVRAVTDLEPLGGVGDRISPATGLVEAHGVGLRVRNVHGHRQL